MVVSVKSRVYGVIRLVCYCERIILALFLVRGACCGLATCSDLCLVRRKPYTFLSISYCDVSGLIEEDM
jgi:hypothetical protein